MKIPKNFVDAIGADAANCVLIVGAGLSTVGVRRGGGGLPDWDELVQAMISHLHDTGRCDEAKIDQLRTLLREEPPRYLDVAEEFALAHRDDSDGYETFLRGLMMPDDLVESELHKLILAIGFRGIVSFNFDRVFEKQSDKLVPIVYPELTNQVGHFQRRGFFAKIHGCITKPARQLVLTRSSYDQLRVQAAYGELLKAVLLSHKVLCVGFSLRDPDFLSILGDLKGVWRENLSPLFSLMQDPGQAARSDWLKRGVAILPYQDHGDVKGFFAELAKLARNEVGSTIIGVDQQRFQRIGRPEVAAKIIPFNLADAASKSHSRLDFFRAIARECAEGLLRDSLVAQIAISVLNKETSLDLAPDVDPKWLVTGIRLSDEYFVLVQGSAGHRDWQRDFAQTCVPTIVAMTRSLNRSGDAQAMVLHFCTALATRLRVSLIWPANPDDYNDLTNAIYAACIRANDLEDDGVLVALRGLVVIGPK